MALSTMSWLLPFLLPFLQAGVDAQTINSTIEHKHFIKAPYCPDQVLASDGLYQTVSARSTIECMAHCRPDPDCRSIVYDPATKDCQLGDSRAHENCSNMEPAGPGMKFYQDPPPCGYGQMMGPEGICICQPGFKGYPDCQRYLADCDDVYNYGPWTGDDVYYIQPLNAPAPFPVYCRFISNARTYIMERKKDQENFFRPWNDYVSGFGDLYNDHFLGLEQMYAITNDYKQFELRVVLKDKDNVRYYEYPYREFRVGDAGSGYALYFNASDFPTDPPAGCFIGLNGAKFSTYDSDNDDVPGVNCAAIREAGWWFNDVTCNTCNPTGQLLQPDTGIRLGVDREVFWTSVLGNYAPHKVTMFLVMITGSSSTCWPEC